MREGKREGSRKRRREERMEGRREGKREGRGDHSGSSCWATMRVYLRRLSSTLKMVEKGEFSILSMLSQ